MGAAVSDSPALCCACVYKDGKDKHTSQGLPQPLRCHRAPACVLCPWVLLKQQGAAVLVGVRAGCL